MTLLSDPLISGLKYIGYLVILVIAGSSESASVQTESTSDPTVQLVPIGVHLLDIYDLDLKKRSFVADFYTWLRWTGSIDPREFEFMNGTMDLKDHPDYKEFGDLKYVSFRCRGTFHINLDFRAYPLDRHILQIQIEDSNHDATELRYIADVQNMQGTNKVKISGSWISQQPTYEVQKIVYQTNYGNPRRGTDENAIYSRFYINIPISHTGTALGTYFKCLLPLFISASIAFLAFMINSTDLDPRFGLGVAAIFGTVSCAIVIASNLPDVPYFTLAEKLHIVALSFIFLSLFESCISLKLARHKKFDAVRRLDRLSGIVFTIAFAGIIVILTLRAANSS
ncbi:MAG: hypothetical protein WCH07_03280 [Deltaproteobacteria bacterium]